MKLHRSLIGYALQLQLLFKQSDSFYALVRPQNPNLDPCVEELRNRFLDKAEFGRERKMRWLIGAIWKMPQFLVHFSHFQPHFVNTVHREMPLCATNKVLIILLQLDWIICTFHPLGEKVKWQRGRWCCLFEDIWRTGVPSFGPWRLCKPLFPSVPEWKI